MTLSEQTKNSASYSNQAKSSNNLTWDEAIHTWDESLDTTWDNPIVPLSKQTKNTASFTNQTKL